MNTEKLNIIQWDICNIKYVEDLSKKRDNFDGINNYEFFNQIHQTILQLYLSNTETSIYSISTSHTIPALYIDIYVNELYRFMEYTRSNIKLILKYIYGEKELNVEKIISIMEFYDLFDNIESLSIAEEDKSNFGSVLATILQMIKQKATSIVGEVSMNCMDLALKTESSMSKQLKTIVQIFDIVPKTMLTREINNKIKCLAIIKLSCLSGGSELFYSFNSLADIEDSNILSKDPIERKTIIDTIDCYNKKFKINNNKLKSLYLDMSKQYPFSEMKWIKTNRNQLYMYNGLGYTLLEFLSKASPTNIYIPMRLYSCAERKLVSKSDNAELQIDFTKYYKPIQLYTGSNNYPVMFPCGICYDVLNDFSNEFDKELYFFDKNGNQILIKDLKKDTSKSSEYDSQFNKFMKS